MISSAYDGDGSKHTYSQQVEHEWEELIEDQFYNRLARGYVHVSTRAGSYFLVESHTTEIMEFDI